MYKTIFLIVLAILLTLACSDTKNLQKLTNDHPLQTKAELPKATKCDPSYPTVCITPYPPDLDCGDIPHRRFEVVPPDPHGFDRDRDGIGCEWD